MHWGSTPADLAARLTAIAEEFVADGPSDRLMRARRGLLSAVAAHEPATLNQVAAEVGRGAPAVSRSVETLVRAGLVDRTPDPANRRRLAMRVTEAGKTELTSALGSDPGLLAKLKRLAPSELRAVERAVEILER